MTKIRQKLCLLYTSVDLAQGEKLPENVIDDLKAPATIKMAHNANFEINRCV